MPIDVNVLYERISVLAKKSQAGWQSSVDFNSDLRDANLTLFEYYVKIFEESQRILDALVPFVVETTLTLTQGQFSATTPFPNNYAHDIELGVLKVTNNPDNDCRGKGCKKKGCKSCYQGATPKQALSPITNIYPCDYLLSNEEKWTLSSGVRKPSMKKNIFRFTIKNNLIHVYPKEVTAIYYKYLRQPATPYWDSTLVSNANGDFEQFLPPTVPPTNLTVDMEFPVQELSNVVDLLLFYLGVEVRESALIAFAKQKQTQPLVA